MTRRVAAKAPESVRELIATLRQYKRERGDYPAVGSDVLAVLLKEIRRLLRAAAGEREGKR